MWFWDGTSNAAAASVRTGLRAVGIAYALLASACVGGVPSVGSSGSDSDGEPEVPDPEQPRAGLVLEPRNGALVAGDPGTLSIPVSGVYSRANVELSVQVLADPADLTSWISIATTETTQDGDEGRFALDVHPVRQDTDRARWPVGGVLRLRIVDSEGTALPFDATDPTRTVLVVSNAGDVPGGWLYLSEKPLGSLTETAEYYQTIDAPPTLADFITRYGFPGGETIAIYYNAGDLGIGREMHCRQLVRDGLACYVRNFGVFGGSRDQAITETVAGGTPLATVAMVYTPPITAPNSVTFMVYGANNALVNEAQLDTKGHNKSIPQNCLNCHGGRSSYDEATNTVLGARFLPFDPSVFAYAQTAGLSFPAQQEKFRKLNRLVGAAGPTVAMTELIDGMFPQNNSPYNAAFVPAGWNNNNADRTVYREVFAPYCRTCHASFGRGTDDPLAFRTAAVTRLAASAIAARVCGAGPLGMPTAEQTTTHFFASNARALLLQWLEEPGACASAPAEVVK